MPDPYSDRRKNPYGEGRFDVDYQPIRHVEPSPPVLTDKERRETFSTTYQRNDICRGLTVGTIEQVKGLLSLFANGSSGPLSRTANDLGQGGILLLTMATRDHNSFERSLFREIDKWAAGDRDKFSKSYDYDGVSSFHKTTVDVERRGESFNLHLNQAYTGSRCEEGLSETAGVPRDFVASQHSFSWAAHGTRAMIPRRFFRDLGVVFGFEQDLFKEWSSELLAHAATPRHTNEPIYTRETDRLILTVYRNYRMMTHFQRCRARDEADEKAKTNFDLRISMKGLSVPATESFKFPGKHEATGLDVRIYPKTSNDDDLCRASSSALEKLYGHLPKAFDR